jgi:hypothetical protein
MRSSKPSGSAATVAEDTDCDLKPICAPSLALWLLDLIEQETFLDPSEAVFVILGEHKELEPHADHGRRELLNRR